MRFSANHRYHPSCWNRFEEHLPLVMSVNIAWLKDHKSINDGHFDMLREELSEREISELCSFISFVTASQKLGRIYNLTENYQENKAITMFELKSK